jgi:hypothetical protein
MGAGERGVDEMGCDAVRDVRGGKRMDGKEAEWRTGRSGWV